MRHLLSLTCIYILFISNLDAREAQGRYECSDGRVSVSAIIDGYVYEEFNLDRQIFENNHRIIITEEGTNMDYSHFVAVTYDGGGQESFQAFEQSRLSPLKVMADFYYEHEGAYLVGGFYSKIKQEWIEFSGERMKCQF